jgi:hypothetical protein
MNCQDLINYFIVDRVNGKTYTPDVCMNQYLTAYSNIATDTKTFIINFSKLKKGLSEKRYRLIKRNINF